MQWSLFVLLLMGQCVSFRCHLYEYHFINESKTWEDAQKYCEDKYTDLATVTNQEDMKRLRDGGDGAWIGLHTDPREDNRKWRWSQPGVEYTENETNWGTNEPNDSTFPGNCVRLLADKEISKIADEHCSKNHTFVCYHDKPQADGKYHFIDTKKTWPEAQRYCRENYTDLVSGPEQLGDNEFKTVWGGNNDVWIGLFRDAWRWSDGNVSSFRDWGLNLYSDGEGPKRCAMIEQGKWNIDKCNEKKPFVCYDVSGQCDSVRCHIDEYHFINEPKTWTEAQRYCRENHTDLATVTNKEDMDRLRVVPESQNGAWIGLHNQPGNYNRKWRWSQPGVEYTEDQTNWGPNEPNNYNNVENCVEMNKNGELNDNNCTQKNFFLCYNGTDQKSYKINETKTWLEAQRYCREKRTDLISGQQQLDNYTKDHELQENVWIGLFRDTWKWSDQSSFSFINWYPEFLNTTEETQDQSCVVTKAGGTWETKDCGEQKPFFCYEDHLILINESMTWVDAFDYCREKHRDLVSITSATQQMWVQEKAKKAISRFVWLGLRYTCTLGFWFWVTDEVVRYQNWNSTVKTDDCDMSGAMDRSGPYKWVKKIDEQKYNFICLK